LTTESEKKGEKKGEKVKTVTPLEGNAKCPSYEAVEAFIDTGWKAVKLP
jgi:hypothetical protein